MKRISMVLLLILLTAALTFGFAFENITPVSPVSTTKALDINVVASPVIHNSPNITFGVTVEYTGVSPAVQTLIEIAPAIIRISNAAVSPGLQAKIDNVSLTGSYFGGFAVRLKYPRSLIGHNTDISPM